MLHCHIKFENQDFRKKSSFFSDPAEHETILTLSPALHPKIPLDVEDYGLKPSMKIRIMSASKGQSILSSIR
jgi:hypothetical protein